MPKNRGNKPTKAQRTHYKAKSAINYIAERADIEISKQKRRVRIAATLLVAAIATAAIIAAQ